MAISRTSIFDVRNMDSENWPNSGHHFSHKTDVRNRDSDVRNADIDVWNRDSDMPDIDVDVHRAKKELREETKLV